MYASQSVGKKVFNYEIQSLFIEAKNYKKIAPKCRMRIETHRSTKRSKRVCLIVTRRALAQSPKGANSALLKCCSALQKCRMVLLDAERSFVFGCLLDSLSRVF